MLKVLVLVLIASNAVFSKGEEEYNPQDNITNGVFNPYSETAHSFYHKEIKSEDLKTWKLEHPKLRNNKAYVPEVLHVPEKANKKNKFDIFYKNLFIIDLKIYRNTALLIKSFEHLLSALEVGKNYEDFTISLNSFAYEPVTRRFVFVDFEKLKTKENYEMKVEDFRKQLATRLLKSLEEEMIPITPGDQKFFEKLGINFNQFPKILIYKEKLNSFTIVDNMYFTEKRAGNSIVNVEFKEDHFSYHITFKHHDNKIKFDQNRGSDNFTIYICRKSVETGNSNCENLQIKELTLNFSEKYYINSNERIDIEVQESESQTNDWYNKNGRYTNQIFYEIFIIVSPSDAPGIKGIKNLIGYPLEEINNSEDLILLETSSNSLIICYFENDQMKAKPYQMNSKPIKFFSSIKINQISPSHLKDISLFSTQQVLRVFSIPKGKRQTIFTLENTENRISFIAFHDFTIGFSPHIYNECKNPLGNHSIVTGKEYTILKYGSVQKSYPTSIALIKDRSISSERFEVCYKGIFNGVSELGFEKKDNKDILFNWNFNSHIEPLDDYSKESFVYANKELLPDPKFNFENFELPLRQPYVVFISITFNKSNLQYVSEVMFFDKNSDLFSISFDGKPKMPMEKLSNKVIYNKNSKDKKTDRTFIELNKYNAVYVSNTEVVYQININKFNECKPNLKLKNEDIIRINCQSYLLPCDHPIPYDKSYTLTEGLSRVTAQAKPSVSITPKSSVESNNSKNTSPSKSTNSGGSTQNRPNGFLVIV